MNRGQPPKSSCSDPKSAPAATPGQTAELLDLCSQAFALFDKKGRGFIQKEARHNTEPG